MLNYWRLIFLLKVENYGILLSHNICYIVMKFIKLLSKIRLLNHKQQLRLTNLYELWLSVLVADMNQSFHYFLLALTEKCILWGFITEENPYIRWSVSKIASDALNLSQLWTNAKYQQDQGRSSNKNLGRNNEK